MRTWALPCLSSVVRRAAATERRAEHALARRPRLERHRAQVVSLLALLTATAAASSGCIGIVAGGGVEGAVSSSGRLALAAEAPAGFTLNPGERPRGVVALLGRLAWEPERASLTLGAGVSLGGHLFPDDGGMGLGAFVETGLGYEVAAAIPAPNPLVVSWGLRLSLVVPTGAAPWSLDPGGGRTHGAVSIDPVARLTTRDDFEAGLGLRYLWLRDPRCSATDPHAIPCD